MQIIHILKNSILIDEALTKATNHYTYQMSPKFLVNTVLCAQPPDSMISIERK